MLEVPVEGALTAKAWLAATARSVAGKGVEPHAPAIGVADPVHPAEEACDAPSVDAGEPAGGTESGEGFQLEVWAVMIQALRALAAVHAVSEQSTHRAVCLANILVAARPAPDSSVLESALTARPSDTAVAVDAGRLIYSFARQAASPPQPPPSGFRRAQLGPPAPAALAHQSTEYLAPEVVRGQPFRQSADVYAFGVALRAACCGGDELASFNAADGVSGGVNAVMPAGRGPEAGPLRQALLQVLESMLEEDSSRRCTALEVSWCVHGLCEFGVRVPNLCLHGNVRNAAVPGEA